MHKGQEWDFVFDVDIQVREGGTGVVWCVIDDTDLCQAFPYLPRFLVLEYLDAVLSWCPAQRLFSQQAFSCSVRFL
jgi:hypothetical protein